MNDNSGPPWVALLLVLCTLAFFGGGAIGSSGCAECNEEETKSRAHFLMVCTAKHTTKDCRELWEATR